MSAKANASDTQSILEAAGYVYSHYFTNADGGVAVISKLKMKGNGPITKGSTFKFGYVQLKTPHPTDATKELAINFYVCNLDAGSGTLGDKLAEIDAELTQSNKENGKPRANYFIAGYFGTSNFSEITNALNKADNANKLYGAQEYGIPADKGPYDTTISGDGNANAVECPDDLIYHTDAWEIQVPNAGGFRRGNTGNNSPTEHYFCFAEAKYISTVFVAAS